MGKLKFSNRFPYPKLREYDGLVGKLPVASPFVYLGLEVEVENVKGIHNIVPGSWEVVEDGSLKYRGNEYVTVPIRFRYIEMELRRLFGNMSSAVFSVRTSIHVHVNSRDLTSTELINFLLLYMIYERSLYNYAGDRWNNNFCMPLHGSPQMVESFLKQCMLEEFNSITWCKYFGLNLLPLIGDSEGGSNRIGTIEFRHMIGNNRVEYIVDWCNLILRLKLAAKRMETKVILEAIRRNATYDSLFLTAVFDQWAPLLNLNGIQESTLGTKLICSHVSLLSKGI